MSSSSGVVVACTNKPLCGTADLPSEIAATYEGRCINCDMFFMRNFSFSGAATAGETCPVCLILQEPGVEQSLFLTYPCGHRICASCFSPFVEELPGLPRPTPQAFGCPASPSDSEEDEMKEIREEAWSNENPDLYKAYCAVDEEYEAKLRDFVEQKRELMNKCPLCRAEGHPMGQDGWRRARYGSLLRFS